MNEAEVLAAIRTLAGTTEHRRIRLGIGDDAAVWQPSRSHRSVISTDMLVDGVHFLSGRMPAQAIGHKALASNLSDLAAMGAKPVLATIALGLSAPVDIDWVRELYVGMSALASRTGTALVGGDLVRSTLTTISITVVGEVRPQHVALRQGARPKDILAVTGPLGGSCAGLALFDDPQFENQPLASEAHALAAHLCPEPRLREGAFLAASKALHAMIDLSDGLSVDVRRIIEASACGVVIDNVPISQSAQAVATRIGADQEAWALHGGEDYELLVAVAPRHFETLARAYKTRFRRELLPIGRCVEGEGCQILRATGLETLPQQAWDHFGATY